MRFRSARTRLITFSFLAFIALAACAKNAKQDALHPRGPVARQEHHLFVPVFWIAAAIFFLVEGLIVYAVVRFRDRPGAPEPKQIHGNSRLELGWTIAPAVLLLGIAIPTVITIFHVSAKSVPNEVRVKVTGHQWWWEYEYEGTNPVVKTANELVIPAGRQVFLDLTSADVIHSFWVPELAGKQDVVPDRTNTLAFSADEPGTYHGQCAEFCSVSHANMRLEVIAKTESDYATWLAGQQQNGAEPQGSDAQTGMQLFMSNACIACHAINGTAAGGQVGPNLTHLASRTTFGSAIYPLQPDFLAQWVKHARLQKPGVLMPDFDRPLLPGDPAASAIGQTPFRPLNDQEIQQIVAYLMSSK
ncbi:MAG: cytochrome c oxidase subunit II [Actinomycetota bacterium]